MSISNSEPYLYDKKKARKDFIGTSADNVDDNDSSMAVKDPGYGIDTYPEDEEIKRLEAEGKVIDLTKVPSSTADQADEEYESIHRQQMEKEEEMRPTYMDINDDEQEYFICEKCKDMRINEDDLCDCNCRY